MNIENILSLCGSSLNKGCADCLNCATPSQIKGLNMFDNFGVSIDCPKCGYYEITKEAIEELDYNNSILSTFLSSRKNKNLNEFLKIIHSRINGKTQITATLLQRIHDSFFEQFASALKSTNQKNIFNALDSFPHLESWQTPWLVDSQGNTPAHISAYMLADHPTLLIETLKFIKNLSNQPKDISANPISWRSTPPVNEVFWVQNIEKENIRDVIKKKLKTNSDLTPEEKEALESEIKKDPDLSRLLT